MANYLNSTSFKDDFMSRVINGNVAERRRYDYHIQAYGGNKACGGILIASNIVLTAAHCKDGFKKVFIGMYKWYQRKDNYKELITVSREIPHPEFDSRTYHSDLMLVVLERDSKFPPVCISNNDTLLEEDKSILHVMGFGKTLEHGSLSYLLREVDVRYINNDSCREEYPHNVISDRMMCCDSSSEKKDACQGDSGGPLIIKGNSARNDVAVGIVSWGIGCARYPGVYTRISAMHEWISEKVQQHGGTLASCGFDDPSKIPSINPNKAQSTKPSKLPSKQPSKDPSMLPSKKASQKNVLTSVDTKCEVSDDAAFRRKGKNCTQLMVKDHWQACKVRKIKAKCPVSCAFQTLSAGKCEDNLDWRWKDLKSKNCDWIANNLDYCSKLNRPDGNQVKFHCPNSCGLCEYIPGKYVPKDDANFMKGRCQRVTEANADRQCKRFASKAHCPVACACF
eukprot:CAMPEP_0194276084 /NCGR_PEP_ID=MMETSP0169-20130528/8760_1 /TAXON_ID=218684 /ORGANISM="Corethron pennatum, Strain L29A3" /LENGTH=451 /DNA_ID=CAMNT_0039019713 /DNA_START=233 /DNA_END=1588 /DNA_ORIENTATION=-